MGRPRKPSKTEDPLLFGEIRTEHGFIWTSPAIRFRALLEDLDGVTCATLDGARLEAAREALRWAIWGAEEIVPRDLHAFLAHPRTTPGGA